MWERENFINHGFPNFTQSESCSVVSNSLELQGLYSPWTSPGQNTGVGSLALLQGIFPTQESNPGLLYCRRILYQLSHKGSPSPPVISSVKAKLLVTQSCLTLCDSKDCSPSGSSVLGILQARILVWVAVPYSRRSSQPRD